jgi:hypothetical protein
VRGIPCRTKQVACLPTVVEPRRADGDGASDATARRPQDCAHEPVAEVTYLRRRQASRKGRGQVREDRLSTQHLRPVDDPCRRRKVHRRRNGKGQTRRTEFVDRRWLRPAWLNRGCGDRDRYGLGEGPRGHDERRVAERDGSARGVHGLSRVSERCERHDASVRRYRDDARVRRRSHAAIREVRGPGPQRRRGASGDHRYDHSRTTALQQMATLELSTGTRWKKPPEVRPCRSGRPRETDFSTNRAP